MYEQVRVSIAQKMKERFDILTVPRCVCTGTTCRPYTGVHTVYTHIYTVSMCVLFILCRPLTINRLCELEVINLSLTGGCGFYSTEGKESLSTARRAVLRDKKTGESEETQIL